MMKKKKRILSLLLAVIMAVSMWSVPVFAEKTADKEIKSGETIEVTGMMTVKFVPEKSGTYYFMSESKGVDPHTYLYKGDTEVESFDDASLPGMEKENGWDFQSSYDFTAGETYYFQLRCYNSSSSWNYQFTIGSNLINHQPEAAEPFVEVYKPEGVTYQWYEAGEITPGSAEVATYEGKTSSYEEATGWSACWTEDEYGDWNGRFMKKDFATGESVTVKLDGSLGDYSVISLFDEDAAVFYEEGISGETGGSYTLTVEEKGTYMLYIFTSAEEEPDVTLRAYSKGTEKSLAGETESTLKNPEIGKKYFCRMKLADGSFMDSKSFEYEYWFSHQPTETEPYVEGNFEDAEGVTYQWYAVSGQEVTPGSAAYVPDDCTYSAVDGWSGGNYYDDYDDDYCYEMFQVELKAGQQLKVETKGMVEDSINLYSYAKGDTVYSLNSTGRDDDTYVFNITEDDIYDLYFYAETDDISVKAYVLDPEERYGKPVAGEVESRLKEPVAGNDYFCRVMTERGILESELLCYDYAITHYPTLEEPYVGLNDTEGVTYQWYELDDSGAEKITNECENVFDMCGYYEEGSGWIGDQEASYENPEHTYYEVFVIYLEEGQTLTVLPKGEVADRIGLYGSGYYQASGGGIGNELYRFKVRRSGIYYLFFYGTTEDIAVEAWIGDVTMKPLEGETQNALSDTSNGGLYSCMVKGENGKELQTGYIDRTYRFTAQPENGAASVQVSYPEDVAEIRWYRGTFGEEITTSAITPSAVTPSAVTSSAVSGAALYPYDAEKGWTGKWERLEEGYTADFLKADLSTGESISFVVDGTIKYGCGLYDYETRENYYKSVDEETDGVYSFTVEMKGTYDLYTCSQTTDVAIRAYQGEINYSRLENQNNFGLYNAEDGFYCCEVEYRNGKTIRSKTVLLEDIETLAGAANPAIFQSEPGTVSASWNAADNASGYAVSLYKDGAVAESCTSAALSHTFDITEKGNYFFTVRAEKRKGADVYDAVVTSAAINIYSVTFDTDGGTTPEALLVAEGERITGPAVTPSKDGYVFDGWYTGEEKWDFGNSVTSDLALIAKWTPDGILGDVDGSGDIKAEDALMVLKSVAHMVTLTPEEEKRADVDKDGNVAAEDALLILKYVAHMVSGF